MATKESVKKDPKKGQKRTPKEFTKILKVVKSLNATQIGELLVKIKEIQLTKIEPSITELEEKLKELKQLKAN